MTRLAKYLIFDKGDINETILLAGSGRSGTTWVEDLLNHDHSRRIIFEPFDTSKNPLIAHWHPRQYLEPQDDRPEFTQPLEAILTGKLRSKWTDQFNRRVFSRGRLIKAIRANQLLPWIHERHPQIPIVFLLRHPCAVAYSRVRMGWTPAPEIYLEQEALANGALGPFFQTIQDGTDDFQRHVITWCVENYLPLTQMVPGSLHVVFYEDLVQHKSEVIQALFQAVGMDAPPAEHLQLSRPSKLSRQDSSIHSGQNLLSSWRDKVSADQIAGTVTLLKQFGLDRIYDENILPKLAADSVMGSIKPVSS